MHYRMTIHTLPYEKGKKIILPLKIFDSSYLSLSGTFFPFLQGYGYKVIVFLLIGSDP